MNGHPPEALHDSGYVRAKVETLESKMDSVQKDIREIRDTIAESKGGLRFLLWVAGLLAALSAGIGAFVGRHT